MLAYLVKGTGPPPSVGEALPPNAGAPKDPPPPGVPPNKLPPPAVP